MKVHSLLSVAGLAFAMLSGPAVAADPVINGSFEQPTVPAGTAATVTPTGWTALGGGVDIFTTGMSGGSASSGLQFVDLIGTGQGTFPSGLYQDIFLQAGTTYQLSFDYNGQAGNPPGAILDYSLGSLVSGSINVDGMNVFADLAPVTAWQTSQSLLTPALSDTYRLTFTTSAGFFTAPFIDNVSVSEVAAAVPEPETYALMLAGFGAIGLFGRRQRRARERARS